MKRSYILPIIVFVLMLVVVFLVAGRIYDAVGGEPRETGHIRVYCEPGVKIYLDGEYKGLSGTGPDCLTFVCVPVGRHKVTGAKAGHRDVEKTVEVKAGKIVSVTLDTLKKPRIVEEAEPHVDKPHVDKLAGLRDGRMSAKAGLLAAEGGDEKTEAAVLSALGWLKSVQNKDGFWDADNFDEEFEDGNEDIDYGAATMGDIDVGVTGLALLAFFGAGFTHDDKSEFAETVKRALQWLVELLYEKSNDDQYYGVIALETESHYFHYCHAIATYALCEAFAMTGSILFQDPAQSGLNYIVRAQNDHPEVEGEKYGWRYYPRDGDSDTSVTGWMLSALKVGRAAKLDVPLEAFKGGLAWFYDMTDDSYFRTGYQRKGGNSAMPGEKIESGVPCAPTETCTAIALLSRVWLQVGRTMPANRSAAALIIQDLPEYNGEDGRIDFYYWYFGSLAMFQMGGENWKRWNEAMKKALIPNQRGSDCGVLAGSWDPELAKWGRRGGRVYATAINCLTLEVYYRYPRIE